MIVADDKLEYHLKNEHWIVNLDRINQLSKEIREKELEK